MGKPSDCKLKTKVAVNQSAPPSSQNTHEQWFKVWHLNAKPFIHLSENGNSGHSL